MFFLFAYSLIIALSFSYLSRLVNSYSLWKAQLLCFLLSGAVLNLPLLTARQNRYLPSQHCDMLYCNSFVFVFFPTRPGVSKLWCMGQTWRVACLCTVCKLRMAFINTWPSDGKKIRRRIFHDMLKWYESQFVLSVVTSMLQWQNWQRPYVGTETICSPQSTRYLLPSPLQKKFATDCSVGRDHHVTVM